MYSAYSDSRVSRPVLATDPRRKDIKTTSVYNPYSYGVPGQSQRSIPIGHVYDDRETDRRNVRYYSRQPSSVREETTRNVYSNGGLNLMGEQTSEVLRKSSPYRQGK